MGDLAALDRHLGADVPDDRWADHGPHVARGVELLAGFDADDWRRLDQVWPRRTARWRERLADCLSEAGTTESGRVLFAMILGGDATTGAQAAAALRDHPQRSAMPLRVRERLHDLLARTSGIDRSQIELLLEETGESGGSGSVPPR